MKVKIIKSLIIPGYTDDDLLYLSKNKEYDIPLYQAEKLIAEGYVKAENTINDFFTNKGAL